MQLSVWLQSGAHTRSRFRLHFTWFLFSSSVEWDLPLCVLLLVLHSRDYSCALPVQLSIFHCNIHFFQFFMVFVFSPFYFHSTVILNVIHHFNSSIYISFVRTNWCSCGFTRFPLIFAIYCVFLLLLLLHSIPNKLCATWYSFNQVMI